MRYELIVFDWDGTLMDSEARIVHCMQQAYIASDIEVPELALIRGIIGLGLIEAVAALSSQLDQKMHQQIADAYRHQYLSGAGEASVLFEGAESTVRNLQQKEIMLAVATGKGRQGLNYVLDDTGLRDCFLATRCADETRSKPHPDMLLEILEELGVSADNALMVGDTDYDMLMARNAGTDALAVSYGVHDRERLLRSDPLDIIDAVTELPEWLKQRPLSRAV